MAVYNRFMNELKMPDTYKEGDETIHGIEHYLPKDLYQQPVHHQAVAADIASGRDKLSKNGKFHAILATKNIPEAIAYYRIFKEQYPSLNVVAVFDNNIDNSDGGIAQGRMPCWRCWMTIIGNMEQHSSFPHTPNTKKMWPKDWHTRSLTSI